MAGLAAAWRLSRPDGQRPQITVYERDVRLGGKGASTRGPDGRIQEHGLHVWLGYYDNAFRLMREAYDELDRRTTDPCCPILDVGDAFTPANVIGLGDGESDWVGAFPSNDLLPGEGSTRLNVPEFVARASALVASFGASLVPNRRAVLSTRPAPPRPAVATEVLTAVRAAAGDRVARQRATHFAELVATMLRGVIADDLSARGYASIDDLDFREWLAQHGASETVLGGPLVRGIYDLVFGYVDGDRRRPRFAAGTGLHLSGRMFFTYRGAIFWKMTAGMGDVVFAPLYQALRARGVRFAFGHRLEAAHVDATRVTGLTFGVRDTARDPLVRVKGLPVWPDTQPRSGTRRAATLQDGADFDEVVFAAPVGVVPHACAEILERDARWRDMVAAIGTVATQAAQVWLSPSEHELGWQHPGAVVSSCGEPFDTMASMSHTLIHEDWPSPAPRTSVSLCTVLAGGEDPRAAIDGYLAGAARARWPAYQPGHVRAVYTRANTDPSERYVQSLPGSGRFRLRADASGFANLALAGDWLDTGLNAGCIEAATLGGLQAANAIEGRPITEGTVGFAPHAPGRAGGDR